MSSRRRIGLAVFAAVTASVATTSGCGDTAPPSFSEPDARSDRASDGLLYNPTLQHIVDLQTRRNSSGIVPYFSHDDALIRARAAFAAASIRSPALIPHLVHLLSDPDPRVRADAAFALGNTADSAVGPLLATSLQREPDAIAQSRMVEAIGRTGGADALTELVSMHLDRPVEQEIALAVARFAMRDIHAPQSIEWVAGRLTHEDRGLRLNAAYYFGITPTSQPWALHAAYVRDAMEDYSLDDPAAMHLATALGRFHGADGHLLLARLHSATDWRVRSNTARALAPMSSDEQVRNGLLMALDDPNTHVATEAARSLAWSEALTNDHLDSIEAWIEEHPTRTGIEAALLEVLATKDRGDFVLRHVRGTIKHVRPGFAEFLPAVALVPSDEAFSMLAGLTQSTVPAISEAAVQALATRWTLWRGAVDGTGRFYDVFTAALGHANGATVVAAAAVLTDSTFTRLGSPRHISRAYDWVSAADEDATIVLLGQLGAAADPAFLFIIERGNQHQNPLVRRASTEAVAELTGRTIALDDWFTAPHSDIDWPLLAQLGPHPVFQLETTRGLITIVLTTEQAPFAVQTVATRVRLGQYDQSTFHRVVPNFIVQGGDVAAAAGNGYHATGRTEVTRLPFRTGVIGLANVGRDTEGSQFFITQSMQPQLDGFYSAFGFVVEGMDVVNNIMPGDRIVKATILVDAATS